MTLGNSMRLFVLERREDESGVSGTGIVAEGCEFTDGACVMKWLVGPARSVGVYANVKTVERVHGHEGRTLVKWLGEPAAEVVRLDTAGA